MNGPQDLGGAMGFGPVVPEADEPVFHAEWERRAFALTVASGFLGQWNIDMARSARESLPPAQYLGSSYYEIWFEALGDLLVNRGMVTRDELEAALAREPMGNAQAAQGMQGAQDVQGSARSGAGADRSASRTWPSAVSASQVAQVLARGGPTERDLAQAARFALGDQVRTLVMHPAHHTRLPRYIRGKQGVIIALHGAHVFPDTNARGLGEQPTWLYTVRFDASELWGPDTTAGSICVDCWEPYLEAVQ